MTLELPSTHNQAGEMESARLQRQAGARSSMASSLKTRSTRLWWPVFFGILGLVLLYQTLAGYVHLADDLSIHQGCRMSRMWPSYQLHSPPSPSGQGTKYRLYLYRENPPASIKSKVPPARKSRPALFVPGNAGSFGQVRSVASWSWHEYHNAVSQQGTADEAVELDWYSIDFNEDFSALHPPTLEGQSTYVNEVLDYIVKLYPALSLGEGSASIPILAHSMGGIVARLASTQPNSRAGLVKTIVTLSTPHSVPPAPIEAGMDKIYSLINTDLQALGLQRDVLLVSLSGGVLDIQLPSEYALLPESWSNHTVQGFTSEVANLWASVDHLAMMWCDQLRRKVVQGFLRDDATTQSLLERREHWRNSLGLPSTGSLAEHQSQLARWIKDAPTVNLPNDDASTDYSPPMVDAAVFNLIVPAASLDSITAFGCQRDPLREVPDTCRPLPPWAFELIPSSTADGWQSFPDADQEYEQIGSRLLRIGSKELQQQGWHSIRVQNNRPEAAVSSAGWSAGIQTMLGKRQGSELIFDLPDQSNHHVSFLWLPQIRSSLVVYEATFYSTCQSESGLGAMIHVRSPATGDGRWYTSLDVTSGPIALPFAVHTGSPYLPLPSENKLGAMLELYRPPTSSTCRVFESFSIRIKWHRSIGLWFLRYRIGVDSWIMVTFALAAGLSFSQADVSVMDTVLSFATLKWSALGLIGLTLVQQVLLYVALPQQVQTWASEMLFGLTGHLLQPFSILVSDWTLTLLFGAGLLLFTWLTLCFLAFGVQFCCNAMVSFAARFSFLALEHDAKAVDSSSKPQWKASTTISLLVLLVGVKFILPYQFVFLSATLIQGLNLVRFKIIAARSESKSLPFRFHSSRVQQNLTTLLHLVLLLPLKAPSLLIFVRNCLAGYRPTLGSSQFGEDHDILPILPVILLVQVLSTGRLIEQPQGRIGVWSRRLISSSYLLLAVYTMAWGIRYPFRLYDLSVLIFSLQVTAHYIARWSNKPTKGQYSAPADGRRSDDEVTDEHSALFDARVEEKQVEEVVMPFSIPDELMGLENARPSTQVTEPSSTTSLQDDQLSSRLEATDLDEGSDLPPAIPSPPPSYASVLTASQQDLDTLITRYLSLLDHYTALRLDLSTNLRSGFFSLAADQMGSGGGWARSSGARRGLWDARLRREVEVEVGLKTEVDDGEKEDWRLRAVETPEPAEDEETEEDAYEALLQEKEGKSSPSYKSSAPSSTQGGGLAAGLRRRLQKSRLDEKAPDDLSSSTSEKPSLASEASSSSKGKSKALPSATSAQKKPKAQAPSALYQFSGLPSPSLRRAQKEFQSALREIVEGSGRVSDKGESEKLSKERSAAGPSRDDVSKIGLVETIREMSRLEELIRDARKRANS